MNDAPDPEESFASKWPEFLRRLEYEDRELVATALTNSGGAPAVLPLLGGVLIGAVIGGLGACLLLG